MRKIILLIFIILIFYPAAIVFTGQEEELKLYIGQPKIISVSIPQRIVISDPKIIDVTGVAEDSLTIIPKEVGVTTLVIIDNLGEQSYRARVLQEDVADVKMRIDALLKELNLSKVYTKLAETESKVLLLGEVKTKEDKERINTILGPLKEKTTDLVKTMEEDVIDIEVQVLELSRGADKELGLAWPTSATLTEPTGRFRTTMAGIPDAFFRISDWTRSTFSGSLAATLSFLEKEGKARILSQPRLACQSGKEAELFVGGEKPIFATSVAATTGATGTTVEYKEYGIKLKIKPTVTGEDRIKLALNVEVSELQQTTAETLGTVASAYPLKKRTASTEVYLNNGQTMVIGGLIKQKTEEDLKKFPWLADIPILGLAFRHKDIAKGGGQSEKGDTELFITLTPTIVRSKEQGAEVSVSKQVAGPPVTTKPLTAEDNIPAELKDYVKAVQLKIINAIYYPSEAKELGWEGTVGLMLRLASNGELKDATVAQSSGYKALDDAALEVVKEQTPYPAFPQQVKLDELRIQVPIVYRKN